MTSIGMTVIPSRHVGRRWLEAPFAAVIETRRFSLGFVIHTWGLRVLLVRWHVILNWRRS